MIPVTAGPGGGAGDRGPDLREGDEPEFLGREDHTRRNHRADAEPEDERALLPRPVDERARRRHLDFVNKGSSISYERVREDLAQRDRLDMEREDSPLKCVEGARSLDTTGRTPQEVLDTLNSWIQQA